MSSTKPKVAVVDNDSSGDFDEKETPAPKNKKRASSESKKPAKKAKVAVKPPRAQAPKKKAPAKPKASRPNRSKPTKGPANLSSAAPPVPAAGQHGLHANSHPIQPQARYTLRYIGISDAGFYWTVAGTDVPTNVVRQESAIVWDTLSAEGRVHYNADVNSFENAARRLR